MQLHGAFYKPFTTEHDESAIQAKHLRELVDKRNGGKALCLFDIIV